MAKKKKKPVVGWDGGVVFDAKAKLDLPMMCLTGTNYAQWTSGSRMNRGGKTLVISQFSTFSKAAPHSWVINRQIREVGSVA